MTTSIRHGGSEAYYSPARDLIMLPPKDRFPGQGEYCSVALHELGHWSGHESRLNRDLSGRFGSETYAREELRAEIASLMLTRELGLPHNPDRHARYVGEWVKVLREEPMEILHASQDAGKIKGFILGFEQQFEIGQQTQQSDRPPENEVAPQSLPERLQTAKQEYVRLVAGGNETDHKIGRFLEINMEDLIKGLPEQTQMLARINFYETLVNDLTAKHEPETVPEQPELFAGR